MTRTFRRLLALAFLLPILAASPARAQLYNAGDACPEPTPGRLFTQEGAAGPSLVCNGTTLEVDESVLTGPYARGVGTATPKAPLHVAGEAIIGPTTGLACDADRAGGIRYNSGGTVMEYCNGTAWASIGGATPAGADREIQFNNAGALGASSTFKLMSDGDLLLTGTYTGTASVPATGAGTRMFFDTQKGAFRAGTVDGTQWDDANIGDYSVAMGRNAIAKNCNGSVALGDSVTASDCGAVALGAGNNATGGWTFATGYGASAQSEYASAIGYGVTAVGTSAHVLGRQLVASGVSSYAIGREAVAGNGVVWGGGDHSMAIGLGDSSGADSTTWPRVTGDSSLGIFMGDQANANITASNVMAVLGGSVVIDPDTTSSATATAKAPLQVVGEVIVGTTTGLACDADRKGGLRWNTGSGCMEICNGTAWACPVMTAACDGTPASFDFTDQNGLSTSTLTESNILPITGTDPSCSVIVSVSGTGSPEYRICADSICSSVTQTWTASNMGFDMNGKYFQVRATTDSTSATTRTITANVGSGSTSWGITTVSSGPCGDVGPADIGTTCSDGSVYAGISPDGNRNMYVARCDIGMTWNGSDCVGIRSLFPWNNGNFSGTVITTFTSWTTGRYNTQEIILLDSDSGTAGIQPHQATQSCADLADHGQTDWYLPAKDELAVIYENLMDGIPNDNLPDPLITGFYNSLYWSSSENSSNGATAWNQRFSDGVQLSGHHKNSGYAIRCARRD